MVRIAHYRVFTLLPVGLAIVGVLLMLAGKGFDYPPALLIGLGSMLAAAIVGVCHRIMLSCPACGASIYSAGLFPAFPLIRQPDTPDDRCNRCGFDFEGAPQSATRWPDISN